MAIQTIPGGVWIPNGYPNLLTGVPAFVASTALTTANSRFAMIFQVPKTGTLDWFETRWGTISNNPDNGVRFSFQDVDSNGNPDNGEDQYSVITAALTTGTWGVPPSYMGSTGGGSGSKRSVTCGDWLACCARFESFVAGDSITMSTMSNVGQQGTPSCQYKYTSSSTDGGASYVKATDRHICIALKYNDGTYAYLGWPDMPALNFNARTYASTTAGADERGLVFQVPFPCRVIGAWLRIDSDAAWDCIIYNAAGSVVASQSYALIRLAVTGINGKVVFPASVTLTPNVDYRLIAKPTTASSITIYDMDIDNSGLLASIDGGPTWMSTNRVDAGAWNNVNTNRPLMGLIIDGFDDSVAVPVTVASVF